LRATTLAASGRSGGRAFDVWKREIARARSR
jgi:hypothetical protein